MCNTARVCSQCSQCSQQEGIARKKATLYTLGVAGYPTYRTYPTHPSMAKTTKFPTWPAIPDYTYSYGLLLLNKPLQTMDVSAFSERKIRVCDNVGHREATHSEDQSLSPYNYIYSSSGCGVYSAHCCSRSVGGLADGL